MTEAHENVSHLMHVKKYRSKNKNLSKSKTFQRYKNDDANDSHVIAS